MRVAMVHNYYLQAGGEDQVFAAELSLLAGLGIEVDRLTFSNRAIEKMNRLRLAASTVWNRQVHHELRGRFREFRPDIVHFHNTFPLVSPAAYYAARAEGAAVVQTLHNFRLLCPQAQFFRAGTICELCHKRYFAWPAIRHACYRDDRAASAVASTMLAAHRLLGTWSRRVDVYVALTRFARSKFVEGGLPRDRLVVKPNFLDPDPGIGRGDGGFALFVGRLSPEKGIHTLIRAWNSLPRATPLKLVGDGPLAEEVREFARGLPNVEWLGTQPLDRVLELIGQASYLVVPSLWYEGFPRVAVEAMAKGTPLVASRLGAFVETVEDGRTGILFTPDDVAGLKQTVASIQAGRIDLSRMRREARSEYEAKYSRAQAAEQILEIYARARRSAAGTRSDPS